MSRGKPLTQCITRGCGNRQVDKGLCGVCLRAAKCLVHTRQITDWEELDRLGLIQENNGIKFLRAFNRATGGRLDGLRKQAKKRRRGFPR